MDFSYRAEYAKSGRSSCKGCKSQIAQESLRLAVMVQSPAFDGKIPNWYHYMCFFGKQRPKSTDDIEHFESLRIPDQEKIKEKIANLESIVVPDKKGKGKKRANEANGALKDFTIDYSKSSRATCRGCELKIMKGEIRISKKDFETEVGRKYGGQDMWHHVECFAKLRSELGFFETAQVLPGFHSLKKEDKDNVLVAIPAIKQEAGPEVKKVKKEEDDEQEKLYKKQVNLMYKYRDQLKTDLSKAEMIELLEYNKQAVPEGVERILDRLSDIMTFGSLLPCQVCKDGQYVFNKIGYICQGNMTEWSKCNNIIKTPERTVFKVPKELSADHEFLKKYKCVKGNRVMKDIKPTNSAVKKEDETDGPKVQRQAPPLYNMELIIFPSYKPQRGREELKNQIAKLGGKIVTKIGPSVMAVIASVNEVEKMGSRMQEIKSEGIHVVSEDFVDIADQYVNKIPELVLEKNICDWGSDPHTRLPPEPTKSDKSKVKKSIYEKSGSKIKLKVKGGGAVDPDSGLENEAHVYQADEGKYTAVLGLMDIQTQRNSFYKLQLLASDSGNKYWVFRAWGRIGTTIGGNKLDRMKSLIEAKKEFCRLYEEKTGNLWEDRDSFVKVPGRMYPIDVDHGEEEMAKNLDITDAPSKLEPSLASLMRLIFDVKEMKKMMLEFELDTEKMPLGKLSKKQILSAYEVLNEMLQILGKEDVSEHQFIGGTNRFYTLIPHSFGIENPPLLNNEDIIKQKIEMLDNLMELEVAYNLMKSAGSESNLDGYYEKLNADVKVMEKANEEYQIIEEYIKNTHAQTHRSYDLEILDVFNVKRKGEEKRFKPFRKLHNRMLLWHGSRTTNFAGIISQGLRIAPPEAPVTGYMFGKGIYFADMVSKSANYCCTSPNSPYGLLLLCEVALGNMHELHQAKYIEKLPSGKHSTKGIGKTCPDPSSSKKIGDIEVPLGKPIPAPNVPHNSALLYNEYIVYHVAQVQAKYLVKVKFNYKY